MEDFRLHLSLFGPSQTLCVSSVESFSEVRFGANNLTGYYGYGYGSVTAGTGTDPGSSVPATSAPYGNSTSIDPSGTAPYPTGTVVPTGDPSGTAPYYTGTAASTGDPSGSGKLTYTAPTGIPAEYYYHHKKPKRNVSRLPALLSQAERHKRYTDAIDAVFLPRVGLEALEPALASLRCCC